MNKKVFLISLVILVSVMSLSIVKTNKVFAVATEESCEASGGTWDPGDQGGGGAGSCTCQSGVDSEGNCLSPNGNTDNAGGSLGPEFEVDEDGSKILDYLQAAINLLTALAGLAITGAVIIGGIQYSTSGGNPQAAAGAKKRIGNAILALLCLVFLYSFLQWLVPGGIFG